MYKDKYILRNVNITIQNGITMIIGPSGIGKTTLLNIISGIEKPTSGSVERMYRSIQILFHHPFLIHELTIRENILLAMHLKGVEASIEDILNELDIEECIDSYPDDLSSGQQNRASLARILVTKPELIVADEPLSNLDTASMNTIINIFKRIRKTGRSIIMSIHNMEYITDADKVIDMTTLF